MNIIEFHTRMQKIKKNKHKIPFENPNNHENVKIQLENYENHLKKKVPYENYENHENPRIP